MLEISGKELIKERLRLMIESKKRQLDDENMQQLRKEIAVLVTKYIETDPENMEIKIILKDYK